MFGILTLGLKARVSRGSIVVPFRGFIFIESYKAIPNRNYYGAYGYLHHLTSWWVCRATSGTVGAGFLPCPWRAHVFLQDLGFNVGALIIRPGFGGIIGALIIRLGFGGVYYIIMIIRRFPKPILIIKTPILNPYSSPYSNPFTYLRTL